jgi:hypothetical protein
VARRVDHLVGEFHRRLRARFGDRVRHVRLFGSYARGEAHEESDIDIIALVRDLTWQEKGESVDIATEISLECGMHLAPVVMSETDFKRLVDLESSFAADILRDGGPLLS